MTRPSIHFAISRIFSVAALVCLSVFAFQVAAQTQVPPAPSQPPSGPTPAAPSQQLAPPPPAGPPTFPKPDPANFTADVPTKDTIAAFLTTSWGYDETRMWQIQAILKTQVEGISKVVIYVGDKTGKQKPSMISFFALPDGKHIIAGDEIISFGEHPFADYRAQAAERAIGPYRGSASKDLEIVEFADFQCPHCKEAQANMEKLGVDFPKARIVFQFDPIPSIHPQATIASEYGVCVAKMAGSTAFFQFASTVFEGQEGLNTADGATLTLNSAATKAGLDPAKVAVCAVAPETRATVDASVKLSADLGINTVPMLLINGRQVPATAPYETLKKIVEYQVKLDGLTL